MGSGGWEVASVNEIVEEDDDPTTEHQTASVGASMDLLAEARLRGGAPRRCPAAKPDRAPKAPAEGEDGASLEHWLEEILAEHGLDDEALIADFTETRRLELEAADSVGVAERESDEVVDEVVVEPSRSEDVSFERHLALLNLEDRDPSSSRRVFGRPGGPALGTIHHMSKYSIVSLQARCNNPSHGGKCRCWITPKESSGVHLQQLLKDLATWISAGDRVSGDEHGRMSVALRQACGHNVRVEARA